MTPHFPSEELACKCGCGMLPAPDFMQKVERLRIAVGFSLPANSAARCPRHNDAVSSTGLDGPHTTGRAIDLGVRGKKALVVLKAALDSGEFTGVGVNQKGNSRFIHLDDLPETPTRPRPHVWSY